MLNLVPRPAPKDTKFYLCQTSSEIDWLFKALANAKEYAWDIETTHPTRGKGKSDDVEFVDGGDRNEKVIGISFCWDNRVAAYLPLYANPRGDTYGLRRSTNGLCQFDRVVADLARELQDPTKDRFTWNGIFDVTWMWICFGIRVPGSVSDGMLAHHLLDENRSESSHRLKDCAGRYLDPKAHQYEQDLGKLLDDQDPELGRYYRVPLENLAPYGCADALYTFQLVHLFEQRLKEEGIDKLYFRTVMPLQDVISDMRITGLPVNLQKVDEVGQQLGAELVEVTAKIIELAGAEFDPGSPEQLSKVLFERLKLRSIGERGKDGYYSTGKEALASLEAAHPIIPLVQRHRRIVKLKGTYVDGLKNLLVGDRYYPDYKIHGTISGRLTERLIVLLPRGEKGGEAIKGLFEAPPGHSFLFRDVNQIELRVAAHVSRDPVMLDGFCNGGPGYDPHSATAIRMFKIEIPPGEDPIKYVKKHHKAKRSVSKSANFLSIYGGLEDRLGTMMVSEYPDIWPDKEKAVDEARGFLKTYFEVHYGLAAAIKKTHAFARHNGYVVSLFGRRRRLPDAKLLQLSSEFWMVKPRDERSVCYGRQSPSLWFDLGYHEDLPPRGIPTAEAVAKIEGNLKAKAAKYMVPMGGRPACINCDKLVQCMYAREQRSREGRIAEAYRQAFNAIIQSGAVDYTNYALVLINREIRAQGLRSKSVLQIHDELGFLVPDDELDVMVELTRDKLEHAYPLDVPIASELAVGRSWGDKSTPSFVEVATKQCPGCEERAPVVHVGAVMQVGQCSSYREVLMECSCGWRWSHPAVFQTEWT